MLANFAATRIDSARITEENMEKRRIEQDLRLAAEIQAQVIMEHSPVVPGYDIAGISRPSYAVGGDYYDLVFDGERLHFALGDVSGKGVGAAMLMAALRATVRSYWRDGTLASAVTRVNLRFLENVPIDRFATCVLATFTNVCKSIFPVLTP